jgi:CheY-like chemotaxis protein
MVLDDVLDLSAIEEGRITLRPRTADPSDEIGLAVALFRLQAEAAGITLLADFAPDLPRSACLDYDRLRQCLSNLISNALKHTKAGHVSLQVTFQPPDLLRIVVQDTGAGIPAGFEEIIFNRHERASKAAQGYGLGLTICRAIARRMGGDVTVIPLATGAAFQLWVPVEAPSDTAPAQPEMIIAPAIRGRTVLIVDDIGTNRMVAASYLGLLHCHALEAASGNEALGILAARSDIDLVLLDINMPQMDGLETLRSIRSLSPGSGGPPVIAMTADASDRDRRVYLDAGMDGYVSKPIDLAALNAEITRLVLRSDGPTAKVV